MKALSVGLIKGNIDEVDQKVQMTWVQPRVLDVQQVSPHFVLCITTEETEFVPEQIVLISQPRTINVWFSQLLNVCLVFL